MASFSRMIFLAASVAVVAGCSPETEKMSAAEFAKPENAAALEKMLASCRYVLPGDSRAASCREASSAKFALDTKEIARIRREQVGHNQGLSSDVVSTIPKPANAKP